MPAAAQSTSSPAQPAEAETPKLAETAPDAAAGVVRRFFTAEQWAAFEKLAELIVPKFGDRPGAAEAEAAGFLDFLIGVSAPERQALYREGLDRLNADARKRYGRPFAQVSPAEAKPVLKPVTEAWTYHPPQDALARFLREAKEDLMQATVNSRQYREAVSGRRRSAAGLGAYWLPLD